MNTASNRNKLCRTCLRVTENSKIPLFKTVALKSINLELSKMITELTRIEYQPDERLPEGICQTCLSDVCRAYFFQQTCIKSEELLLKILRDQEKAEEENDDELVVDGVQEGDISMENPHEDEGGKSISDEMENNHQDDAEEVEKRFKTIDTVAVVKKENIIKEEYVIMEEQQNDGDLMVEFLEEEEDGEAVTYDSNVQYESNGMTIEFLEEYEGKTVTPHQQFDEIDQECKKVRLDRKNKLKDFVYDCQFCPMKYIHFDTLIKHRRKHHAEFSDQFKSQIAYYKEFLKQQGVKNPVGRTSIVADDTPVSDAFFKCMLCSETFINAYYRKRHMREKHPQSDDEVDAVKEKVICDVCGKDVFKSVIEKHMLVHSEEKPFSCDICSKTFKSEVYLKDHHKRHTATLDFFCDICNKGFTRKRNLKVSYFRNYFFENFI